MELLDRLKAYTKIDGTIFDPVDHAQDTYEAVKMIEALQQELSEKTADLDRWKAQCRSPASKPQWGNSTMNFNMETSKPELKIGMFTLSQSCVGREDHVSIYLEDGEGGEFKISELEKVIKKFYEENF